MSSQAEAITPLELLAARYRGHLELHNYSPRTVAAYAHCLRQFIAFLKGCGITEASSITAAVLGGFQRWLFYEPTWKGTARTAASSNRVLTVARGFCRFLHQEGYLSCDPGKGLEYAREPDALPRNVLTPEEARRIVEAPDTATVLGYRDRTILEVLYATGLRKQELMNLTVGDVNLEEELLRINSGKGGRDRVTPLSQVACSFLETYIHGVRPELLFGHPEHTDRLFISLRGRPMGRNTVGGVVEKYARLAKVKKHVTCHLWRHTCATHLLQNQANLRHVQEILGHRSLATTERYLRVTITDLKEAHRKFHPREKDRHED